MRFGRWINTSWVSSLSEGVEKVVEIYDTYVVEREREGVEVEVEGEKREMDDNQRRREEELGGMGEEESLVALVGLKTRFGRPCI